MTFWKRIWGVILFKPNIYRTIANDSNLTIESLLIIFTVAALDMILYFRTDIFGIKAMSYLVKNFLIGWFIFGLTYTYMANVFFKRQIQIVSVLRTLAYLRIFHLFSVVVLILEILMFGSLVNLGTIGNVVAILFGIITNLFCIRVACDVSTKQAIVIFLLSLFAVLITSTPALYVLGIY